MIKKPRTCADCPVCRVDKKRIICGVWKENFANKGNTKECAEMHKNCPLEWD